MRRKRRGAGASRPRRAIEGTHAHVSGENGGAALRAAGPARQRKKEGRSGAGVAVVRRAREKDEGEGDNGGSRSGAAMVHSLEHG